MLEKLNVEIRGARGKRNARRMRNAGMIPAVLYGHKQETLSLSVTAEQVETALRHGSRAVDLTGALSEQAFIRELQWDTWGKEVLHVDLMRISAHEKVEVRVPVELRGEAPGVKAGGVVEHHVHELDIECEATSIPEKVQVNINHLELDQSITIADLKLPEGVRVLDDPETIVVHCGVPSEAAEEEEAAPGEIEPEVIGRKKADEEEEE
jgi:large subunit ribosomal protein L25